MALLTCEDCGRKVSDLASSCPGCGRPLSPVLLLSEEAIHAKHLQPQQRKEIEEEEKLRAEIRIRAEDEARAKLEAEKHAAKVTEENRQRSLGCFGYIVFGILLLVGMVAILTPATNRNSSNPLDSGQAGAGVSLDKRLEGLLFEIVDQKRVRKGASINPVILPRYVLHDVKAALIAPAKLTETNVTATLKAVLEEVRDDARKRGEQLDGISAFLFSSRDHIAGGSMALGRAEWWPKGHSFEPDNAVNIENKATYVEEIKVFTLPKSTDSTVERLSETKRKEIHDALVRSQDRAHRDADRKFESGTAKNLDEYDKLQAKYAKDLLGKYGITSKELDQITDEGFAEQWPLPPPD